ncbi:MAG TPA: hypothetical protein VFK16_06545, partial [Gemmatimonadaceae bacterium]|nr:hypothetical protein [Gemmatimonadaceae bacterium]
MLRSPSRVASRGVARALFALCLVATALPRVVLAQRSNVPEQIAADRALLAKETYVTPPAAIMSLVTAPRQNNVSLRMQSPDRLHFLEPTSDGLPSVREFGKSHLYFGGLQVDPAANRARTLTTRGSTGLSVIDATTGKVVAVQVPAGATVSSPVWSPDSRQVAYIANFDQASYVYVADAATGKSTQASRSPLLATLVTSIDWTADGSGIVAVFVPDPRA